MKTLTTPTARNTHFDFKDNAFFYAKRVRSISPTLTVSIRGNKKDGFIVTERKEFHA